MVGAFEVRRFGSFVSRGRGTALCEADQPTSHITREATSWASELQAPSRLAQNPFRFSRAQAPNPDYAAPLSAIRPAFGGVRGRTAGTVCRTRARPAHPIRRCP